jgi:very-short-patch-repair endonuclease
MKRVPSLDQRIVGVARSSHLVVSRAQLLAIGCSERQIDYRLERGSLWRTFTRAYAVGVPPRTWRALWQAAVLSAGPGSMLAGEAAAALLQITDKRSYTIDVQRNHGRNRHERSSPESGWSILLNVWTRSNLPERAVIVDGIPLLPVPELLIDLAGRVSPRRLEALVSGASQKAHLSEAVVARMLKQGKGQKGIASLRHHLRFWDPEMRKALSVLETKFIVVCRKNGIPIPESNEWVCGLLVDFLWRDLKVVVEVDGFTFHGDRAAFERDHDRAAVLMRNGYLRLTFTWRQVVEDPEGVAEAVLAALRTWSS